MRLFRARYTSIVRGCCVQVAVQEGIEQKIPWACLDLSRDHGQTVGPLVINMAGYSAHVCYAIEEVLMRPMGIYNGESIKSLSIQCLRHPIPLWIPRLALNAINRKGESCIISQSHMLLSKIIDRRRGTITILPIPGKEEGRTSVKPCPPQLPL